MQLEGARVLLTGASGGIGQAIAARLAARGARLLLTARGGDALQRAAGRDYLDNTIRTPEEIERFLHTDVLATVPRYDAESVHLVTEAYQSVRTALLFARRGERGQVVLVTGSAPQERKTTTLVNVGKLLASSGQKTLIVDLDLRRATLHGHVGLTREPGLTSHFVNQLPTDSLIRPTRIPHLFALTAGPIPPNPPGLLARKTMADMLEEFRAHFSWILLDSPPLASVTKWTPPQWSPKEEIAHCWKCHGSDDMWHDKVRFNNQQGHMDCLLCHQDHTKKYIHERK